MHQKVRNAFTKGNTGKTRSLIRQEKRKRGEDGKYAKDNVAQFHMKKKRGQDRTRDKNTSQPKGEGGGGLLVQTLVS